LLALMFDEAVEVMVRLFTETTANFAGKHYQLNDAYCEPKPVQKPHPPLVIGGSGEQLTLRVVARYADVWNSMPANVEEFQHKIRVLHEHCAAVGRDPNEIELSVQTRINYDDLGATVETLQPLIEAGATHLVLMLAYPYPDGIVERVAEEVVGRVGVG